MKQLVCDFCVSLRHGIKAGVHAGRTQFEAFRQVRKMVKEMKISESCDEMDPYRKKVNDVRELAQKNYKSEINKEMKSVE
ncbi:MAG: hypothetical protein EBU90_16990 [Proteobacteria bacterium]|nr:hypothetical protein [Pseudomonadota bacterium]